MALLKCKICGGDIEVSDDRTFGTCLYCGCAMTFPKINDEQRAAMFNRGNHYRLIGDFDRAISVYEQIINENNTDAEAHWCCALSRFGIEYVEDPTSLEWIPTCHRVSFDSFLDDVDYLNALEYSDGITKKQYMKDALRISEVQKGILKTSQNEEPFDVFICYKESDEAGNRTIDSTLAQDIYYQLTDKGYRTFFSRITLEDKVGSEYEPYIFAALNSAKVMLVIGTRKEYLESTWVKNEWSRFLAIMRKNRNCIILPCYRDMDPYDMPEALSVLQSYDMSKIGFIQDLLRGIGKIVNGDRNEKAVNSDSLEGGVLQATSIAPLLKRIRILIEDEEFVKADAFCENVLNMDPENSEAYLLKTVIKFKIHSEDELAYVDGKLIIDSDFSKALKYAEGGEKQKLNAILEKATEHERKLLYEKADELASHNEIEDLCIAYEMFGDVLDYCDAREKRCKLEREKLVPIMEKSILMYENSETYNEKKELRSVFELLAKYFDTAKEYYAKANAYFSSWRADLDKIIQESEGVRTAKELYEIIKQKCPILFEAEEHKAFAKDMEQMVLVEKFYGLHKNEFVELVEKYIK